VASDPRSLVQVRSHNFVATEPHLNFLLEPLHIYVLYCLISKEKISAAAAAKDKFKKENEREKVAHG
jgi:hypothetical protein